MAVRCLLFLACLFLRSRSVRVTTSCSAGKVLLVETKGSTDSKFYVQDWEGRTILTKAVLDSSCFTTYVATCTGDSAVLKETIRCDSGVTVREHCIADKTDIMKGFSCLWSDISASWGVILKVPMPEEYSEASNACKIRLGQGSHVKLSIVLDKTAELPTWTHTAQPANTRLVYRLSKHLFGEGCTALVHEDKAIETLQGLAVEKAEESSSRNREAVTLSSLWALLFARNKNDVMKRTLQLMQTGDAFAQLANDIAIVEGLKVDPHEEPSQIVEVTNFARYYQGLQLQQQRSTANKRRALIFTCSFGGGHRSASTAVAQYLETIGFTSKVVDTTKDAGFDNFAQKWSASFFNEVVIANQQYGLHNMLDKLQQLKGVLTKPCPSPSCDNDRKRTFRNSILSEHPDLLVTVYHMEILPVLELAKELGNLPLLHIATDIDIKMQEVLPKPVAYPRFMVGVPFDLAESYATLPPLRREQTFLSGYPVRPEFLRQRSAEERAAEKAKLVPNGTRVLLIMTGGAGQDVPWPYKLAEKGIGMPLHVMIVAGKRIEIAQKLEQKLHKVVEFPGDRLVRQGEDPNVTIEVVRDPNLPEDKKETRPFFVYGEHLSLLMSIADVMLTKPGGGSTAEVVYSGVPAVFDLSHELFHWEQFTVDVFRMARPPRGIGFRSEAEFRQVLRAAMGLGRSTALAEESGEIIDPTQNIPKAVEKLMLTECDPCPLFA